MTCKLYGEKRTILARGICCRCYKWCQRQIDGGHATWETIVQAGYADPPHTDVVIGRLVVAAKRRMM